MSKQLGLGDYGKQRIKSLLSSLGTPLNPKEQKLYTTLGILRINEQKSTK
jgi:hypothetical protein